MSIEQPNRVLSGEGFGPSEPVSALSCMLDIIREVAKAPRGAGLREEEASAADRQVPLCRMYDAIGWGARYHIACRSLISVKAAFAGWCTMCLRHGRI